MTELEKAKETVYWMDFFELLRGQVNKMSTETTFNRNLKREIEHIKTLAQEIIEENEKETNIFKDASLHSK